MRAPDVQGWVDKAAEDEAVVEALRVTGGPWSAAAYHAQQAAEKYAKAVVVSAGKAPPRTHDLELLVGLSGKKVSAAVQASAAAISAFAVLIQYPGGPTISKTDVLQAEADLAVLKQWAIEII